MLFYKISNENLIYELIYYDDIAGHPKSYNIDGRKQLLFNEVIAINPHNINIYSVYVGKPASAVYLGGQTGVMLYLYSTSQYTFSNIYEIKSTLYDRHTKGLYNDNQMSELLHIIDLWLTKFVQYHNNANEK